MEEQESNNRSKKCTPKTRNLRQSDNRAYSYQYHHQLLQNSYMFNCGFGFNYQNPYKNYPALLPLPPTIPLQLTVTPPFLQNQSFTPKTHLRKSSWRQNNPPLATSSECHGQDFSVRQASTAIQKKNHLPCAKKHETKSLTVARRPDSGGTEGKLITLLANHFLVKFDPSHRLFHYDVEISPNPSKQIARAIKQKLVSDHSSLLSNARPVYDGRRTIYSPVEFQNDRLEFHISLPITEQKVKIFKVNIKLVSKLDGEALNAYLTKNDDFTPLPHEYIHALDVVLRENPMEKCISAGSSFYSKSMGGVKEIGGGALAYRGFFQSLRPTQQGLVLNVDFSVTAFHESIGVIPYLQKRFDFIQKTRHLKNEEKNEIEKALKNIRVFVRHRETAQRYRVYGLTDKITENLWFPDRDGTNLRLVDYFKEHYDYDVRYRNLPCLQISRRKPCYLPMELCVICEGQSGNQEKEFRLQITKEMTRLTGRILQPPKLKLGHAGRVRNLTPTRHDRQWNLLESHVVEATRIERWALISFGGTIDQKSIIPKFIHQLSQKCQQFGIFLNPNTVTNPIFEPMHVLNNPKLLESNLKKIHFNNNNNLQLIICVMEKKHKGYADLKRVAETDIGVVSQCCLYLNLEKLSSQFLANLALKINVKIGGCTVALYNSSMPRIFGPDEHVIFMGADVTHPHPTDDSSPSVAAVVGSINWPASNKYVSRMRSQTHRQEIIQDLGSMVREILDDFREEQSKLPGRIIFFRDGVSETQFDKVLKDEIESIREAFKKFPGSYNPPITFIVVQKRHHTRLFPCENDRFAPGDENVPPGTVVDTVIAHPSEFDFYLCSHWGVKGTSRPVHYHVLWDENKFTSDEMQKMVYNLCYTFVRCTKPISLVPPAYYAHLAAYRGRLYLERSDLGGFGCKVSRASIPKVLALPKLSENIRKLMFYC
ncbi:protein argonaute 7 [Phtheirospermum japonicum]|uniref:Protein argonaute 7 n=1 Tax=Phtheirospermum japonicum TaxID=374723 RepID=A0A830BSA4_9LAMI|nr:protein argonaute 7 [Phtheirospermum japonicum]